MGCCSSQPWTTPTVPLKEGTTLVEIAINSLDNASWVAGTKPDGYTPLVMRLPKQGVMTSCCDCAMLQRIPTGFFPILTRFGRDINHPGEDAPEIQSGDQEHAKNDYAHDGGQCHCLMTQVSKLVTKQLVVFETPVKQCKTQDNISVTINVLIVFKIFDGRTFIYNMGPEKLDLYLHAALEEAIRTMASAVDCTKLYGLQGADTEEVRTELNSALHRVGVDVLSFTVVNVQLPPDLVMAMQAKTGFASMTQHLEAEQVIRMQGMENQNEIVKIQEEAKVDQMKISEEGATQIAEVDIQITEILSKSSKECARTKAEYEEQVQGVMNDAELEVQDLNNQRDSVEREVKAQTFKEVSEIRANSYMYAREKELEKVIKQAENRSKAKQVVANSEAEASEVLAARRKHEQDLERLKVYEGLSRNKDLRIAATEEIEAGANLSFAKDDFDDLVGLAMSSMKKHLR